MTHRLSLTLSTIFLLLLSSEFGCSLASDFEGYEFKKPADDKDAQKEEETEGGIENRDGGRTDVTDGGKTDAADGAKTDVADSGTVTRCKSPDECTSGYCVDGYCCDRRCAGGCESCSVPERVGTCTPVPRGEDPNGFCPRGVGDNAPCIPGGCNGENGCLLAPQTQECRPPSCSDGVAVNRAFCRENGVCPTLSEKECHPYTCGDDSCNTSCEELDDCHPDYYCDRDSNDCVERKSAGEGCDAPEQCVEGLTCLDGVCCNQDECPACRNCGDDGECSVVIQNEKDDSGIPCNERMVCDGAGDCRQDLGIDCSDPAQCASDICLDNVCCSQPECDPCMNCGSSGECDDTVEGRDDISGVSCSGEQTCNDEIACVRRWELVSKAEVDSPFNPEYVTAAGMNIMFANENNSSATHYVKLFNATNKTFSDAPTTNDEFCYCGYMGTLVSYDTAFFYMANDAVLWKPGYPQWDNIANYLSTPDVRIGEAATAVMKGRIYRVGGRGKIKLTQYYDIGPNDFVTTGIAEHPVGIDSACAGAYEDKLYVLYYLSSGTAKTSEYTESSNSWVILPDDDNAPGGCYYRNFPLWRKFLLHSWNGFRRFNVESRLWEPEPIPIPDPTATRWTPAVTSDGVLYALGYSMSEDETEKLVLVYKWVLD